MFIEQITMRVKIANLWPRHLTYCFAYILAHLILKMFPFYR